MSAPVVLFVYARPDHTRRTVEALQKNDLAQETDLIVYSDAARTPEKEESVAAVRNYVAGLKGFRSLTIHERQHNYGLAKSIIEGVTEVINKYGRVIVLEDDLVTSQYFLSYMNDGLDRYASDDRVISILGYLYPIKQKMPEAFFLQGAASWGWATWDRGWDLFNSDGQSLLNELQHKKLTKAFNFNGSYSYTAMLEGQINGKNDSWAIRWHASAFLAGKFTLYPGRSLVQNIGHDDSGSHCGTTSEFDVKLSQTPINLKGLHVEPSASALRAVEKFFWSKKPIVQKVASLLLSENGIAKVRKVAKDWMASFVERSLS